jgi:23S rRNA (uracil1939-C5)-methyltransferase
MAGTRRPRRTTGQANRARAAAGFAGEVELTVARIGAGGDGVAATASGPVFLPFTVPGDRVRVSGLRRRGEGLAAGRVEILSPGPGRALPPCIHFGRCGGCALQHLADDAYAAAKRTRIADDLARQGLVPVELTPLQRTPAHARRRARLAAIRPDRAGSPPLLGFKVRNRHEIVDLRVCPVLQPPIVAVLPSVRALLAAVLKPGGRAEVAIALLEGGLDVVFAWPEPPDLAARERLVAFAGKVDAGRVSWQASVAALAEPVVQRRPVGARFGDVFVAIPPGGFVQASAEGEAALTAAVLDATRSARRVADLFSGAGTFTFPLAAAGARVLAVDSDGASLRALAEAARQVSGVQTLRRDLFSRPLVAEDLRGFDAVVLDPPRAGGQAQAQELARSSVPVIAALSCNPTTFARDARILVAGGYRLDRVTPVDQFLWSPHLELAAVFRR